MYVNVGAWVSGERPATKKALADAVSRNPSSVSFTRLAHGESGTVRCTASAIGSSILSVTGPDPFRRRNWHANVQVVNGKVTVS